MKKVILGSRASLLQVLIVALLFSIPPMVVLLDIPATTLASCGSYGYACPQAEVACFGLEFTTDSGSTWKEGSAYIYGQPGTTTLIHVRTLLGAISGELEGWQFGVRHDGSAVTDAGGAFDLVAVQEAQFPTLKCGSPPDFKDTTEIRPCGFTQGIVIDTSSSCKLTAPAGLETASACYSVTFPQTEQVYPVTLSFTDNVGDPPIESVVTQDGETKAPCKFDITLNIYSTNSYYPTTSYCPLTQQMPVPCPEGSGGGGPLPSECTSVSFIRGNVDTTDPDLNLSDGVSILNYLFKAGNIRCKDAADTDDNGTINLTDPIRVFRFLFAGGPQPAAPFPSCGTDSTQDNLDCQLYEPCPLANDADGDLLSDACENALGTDPMDFDTDKDGFTDAEEVLDWGVDGFNISTLSANPLQPDIFVEIDWFELIDGANSHQHKPLAASLELVIDAFANANAPNGNNVLLTISTGECGDPNAQLVQETISTGITLHIDAGDPTSGGVGVFNLNGLATNRIGGQAIQFDATKQGDEARTEERFLKVGEDIDVGVFSVLESKYKSQSEFFEQARSDVFHYCLFVHSLSDQVTLQSNLEQTGGVSQGIHTDDFIVSLGSDIYDGFPYEPVILGASIFMHELGHVIGLRHPHPQFNPV